MTQTERRKYLIGELIKENAEYKQLTISQIPQDEKAQENLLKITVFYDILLCYFFAIYM
ncbi:hypothetical protein [Treponema pedis]|uniref:Uncharacterized protein n=1 Tax=Treponema pedis TaxID=409322 RepID=A0A7S6WQ41_9SPIR|nr:hypothetical protein [Treponema pedis]QOW61029.1 hypothetical protein IFE08_00985 [Treponema pedis]